MCGEPVAAGPGGENVQVQEERDDPNALVRAYGADTTRLFCLFAAPPEKDLEWSEQGVDGGYRFLNRIWRLAADWMDSVQGVSAYDGGLMTWTRRSNRFFARRTRPSARSRGTSRSGFTSIRPSAP